MKCFESLYVTGRSLNTGLFPLCARTLNNHSLCLAIGEFTVVFLILLV